MAAFHRIVIVGGGAGGLELAVRLARADEHDVLLLDRAQTHVWKPRLHELAAGFDNRLNENDYVNIAEAWNFAFEQGELADLDPANKRITLKPIEDDRQRPLTPERVLEFGALVLALGGVTPDMGVAGVVENAVRLDSQHDAHELFHRFSSGLLAAAMEAQSSPYNVVVVGSGATGVELGAYLATHHLCKALAPRADVPAVHVHILEAADTFMPDMDKSVSRRVAQRLSDAGVEIHTGSQVSEVTTGAVKTANGKEFPAQLTVWAAGRVGPPLAANIPALKTNKKRQWIVGPTLQTFASEAIFALGDCAYIEQAPVAATAQAATAQSKYLTSAVPRMLAGAELEPFDYRRKGTLLSLGGAGTLGKVRNVFGHDLSLNGRFANTAYRGLQRRHQNLVMGLRRGIMRMLSDMIEPASGPRLKVPWSLK